ncbi:hypothetical protein [Micromonospora sp. DT233]|uniref:hypothetical protein n=1 Tax=Micromonospora sp. DT233 TaxID=3393432 RepID=UPI003CEC5768
MSEPARKIAEQAEERLDRVAKSAQRKLDTISAGQFTDKIKKGRFADRTDHDHDHDTDTDSGTARGGETGR